MPERLAPREGVGAEDGRDPTRLVRAGPVKESEDVGHAFSQHRVGDGLEAVDLTELWDAAAVPPLPCRFDVATLPRRVTVDDDHLVAATRRQQ